MATQFFSDEQMERLRSYPDIGREELIRFFTLTRKDLGFIDNLDRGGGRGPAARLGLAVQLCTLPWLGFVPDDIWAVPQAAVLRLANQLAVYPGMLEQYGRRAQTRSDHLKLVLKYLDWKPVPTTGETLKEMVATARTGAGALTSEKVDHLLTRPTRADLDRLLVHDPEIGATRLAWLTTPAVEATPTSIKLAIDKLMYLRALDAHLLDLSMLPRERRRFLATLGQRSTVQGLRRREERRFPILLAVVAQSAVDQLDEVIALLDQAVSGREPHAKAKTDEALAERAKRGEARQLLMDVILPVLVDPGVPDEHVGGMLRERIGMDKLREVAAVRWKPLPRDHGRLAALEASYTYLRKFTPRVLAAVDFQGGPGTADLMDAVTILRELNRTGGRKVPAGAPTSFVPARYADYLAKARKSGDDTAFRHYWELCTVLALRDGLRSGDVFAPLRRPGNLPVHPRAVGGQTGGVLPAGPQTRSGGRGDRAGQGGAPPGPGGSGGDARQRFPERRRRGPAGRGRTAGHPAAVGRGHPGRGQGTAGGAVGDAAVRTDRFPADRAGRPHRLPGLLHPRRRPQIQAVGGAETQHPLFRVRCG
ncbi:DUF4158 domain-containing protein [Nonomuraea sp. JJY05]|uniref:DUF4158 domain-containing protein n=1 Tax=Nonomuraea sp. JJY05 TaxID=3350255 RepID=UPI00373E53C5